MRAPGYEYLDRIGTGQPYESTGRETMTRRSAADVGRPRGAAARVGGRGPDAATMAMRADWQAEVMRMKTRLYELTQPR